MQEAARRYHAHDDAGAAACARAIVAAEPRHFDALHLLGILCLNLDRPADATSYLRRAVAVRPDNAQAHCSLADALLGAELHAAAEAAFRAALRLSPGDFDALNNLGNALAGAGQHAQAIESFHQALAVRPNAAPALYNLARSLAALSRYDEAITQYRAALAHAGDAPPDRLADIAINLCNALVEQERYPEALAACRDVPPQLFGHPLVAWNESLTRLMLGEYRAGWRLYEGRFLVPDHDRPRPGAVVPDIGNVAGKRVLVFGEQGRGDIIQFARYLPMLAARGATVIAEVYPDLRPLVAEIDGVAEAVGPDDATPQCDLLTPLLSLPYAFGTEVPGIPATVPYLAPPRARAEAWAARLGERVRPRVALCWWGEQHIPRRSLPAHLLTPLVVRQDMDFHAVQKEIGPSDADWLARHPAIRSHGAELRDFADTAAVLAQMDLVITIDTAVAHLAGALGRPVWILLPFSADWRWFATRTDSPWYPTARLFRQIRPGDWPDVIQRAAIALDALQF